MKELSELPLSEKIIIYLLLGGVEDPNEKLRILYHYLEKEDPVFHIIWSHYLLLH
jgi:hypothetical protein